MKTFHPKKGFTLIELLVVTSIISLLSGVVLTAVNATRSKTRDTQRVRDIGELKKAITLYYSDYGAYPDSGYAQALPSSDSRWNTSANPLYVALVPQYIPQLPVDPINTPVNNIAFGATSYAYVYTTFNTDSNKTDYDLITRLENSSTPNSCASRPVSFCDMHTATNVNWGEDYNDGGKILADH